MIAVNARNWQMLVQHSSYQYILLHDVNHTSLPKQHETLYTIQLSDKLPVPVTHLYTENQYSQTYDHDQL